MQIGVVVIGRNEGERLVRCLRSVARSSVPIVYVDSGSTDDSVRSAAAVGASAVELDRARPFSAARARNEGFRRLLELNPRLELVQFIDGDCELDAAWLETARAFLTAEPACAAVAGRRRERFPEASPYNRLADMEWDTPLGDVAAFGGDVMIRARALEALGGYRETLIAGEDPDLSFRMRQAGHRIVRLDREMTLHDANLMHFAEFWRRQVRTGHSYAELLHLHGASSDRASFRAVRSSSFWGLAAPAAAILLAPPSAGASLALGLAGLAVLWLRIFARRRGAGRNASDAALYASGCVAGKFAEAAGATTYAWNRFIRSRATALIEYK